MQLPTLTISGPFTCQRSAAITLVSALAFPSCIAATSSWMYQWSVLSAVPLAGTIGSAVIPVTQLQTAVKQLSLPALALSSGFDYTFKVVATSGTTQIMATAVVTVGPSSLVAIIAGGNRLVSPSIVNIFDGSASKDPDGAGAPVTYLWSCYLLPTQADPSSICVVPLTYTTAKLTYTLGQLLANRQYTFTLQVQSVTLPLRTATTSVIISTSSSTASLTAPILSVSFVSGGSAANQQNAVVTAGAILRLQALITIPQGSLNGGYLGYVWTEVSSGLSLDSRTSDPNSPSLVLPANTLVAGKTYTFRLTVTLYSASGVPVGRRLLQSTNEGHLILASAWAEMVRIVAMPPSSTATTPFTISPATGGIALSTVYTLSANQWNGVAEPLTYTFKQVLAGSETILGSGSALSIPSTTTYLPSGTITIALYVSDANGATTRVTSSVTVVSPVAEAVPGETQAERDARAVASNIFASNVTASLLNQAINTQDGGTAVDIVRMLSDVLNGAPVSSTDPNAQTVREQLREDFINILATNVGTAKPDQIASALDSLTSTELTNTTATLAINVATQILTQLSSSVNDTTVDEDNRLSTATSITGVLSNLLGTTTSTGTTPSDSSSTVQVCSALTDITTVATRVIDTALLADTIPGEDARTVSRDNLAVGGQRSLVSGGVLPTQLVLGGSNVQISEEAISSDSSTADDDDTTNDYADIRVVQYASTSVSQCYNITNTTSSNDTLVADSILSPITDITIANSNGSITPVSGLNQPIVLGLPIAQTYDTIVSWATRKCQPAQPTCSWFDHDTNEWSTEGCTTISTAAASGSGSTVTCSCNHLTEFAILARQATSCDTSTASERVVYSIYAILYGAAALLTVVQLVRIVIYTRSKCKFDLMAAEHVCVLAVTLFRCATLILRAQLSWATDINDLPVVGVGLLTAVPYLFQFIGYTFLVATWASVYHFAMQNRGQSPFTKLRIPFAIANLCIAALVFGLFGGLASTTNEDDAKRVAIGGTCAMAVLTITMVVVYLIYGSRLIATLTKTGGAAAAQSPVVKNLYYATAAFCTCFIIESLLWIISVGTLDSLYSDSTGILAAYYGVNLLSMLIILAMFRQGVNKLAPKSLTSSSSSRSLTDRSKNDSSSSRPNSPTMASRNSTASKFAGASTTGKINSNGYSGGTTDTEMTSIAVSTPQVVELAPTNFE